MGRAHASTFLADEIEIFTGEDHLTVLIYFDCLSEVSWIRAVIVFGTSTHPGLSRSQWRVSASSRSHSSLRVISFSPSSSFPLNPNPEVEGFRC